MVESGTEGTSFVILLQEINDFLLRLFSQLSRGDLMPFSVLQLRDTVTL